MRNLFILLAIVLIGCATSIPTKPKTINMKIEGNVSQVVVVEEHPCEGNWNFCDYVDKD